MRWSVYLSGEIHTDWREQIRAGCAEANLPVDCFNPVTDHAASDDVGQNILGPDDDPFWKDKNSAQINGIRTRTLIERADIVVVRFGERYRQWNAAFDAGLASALGKSVITLHDDALIHPLKEVNAAAMASCRTPEQVVQILGYVTAG